MPQRCLPFGPGGIRQLRPYRSGGNMAANDPVEYERHMLRMTAEDYPGELPELPPFADFDPRDEDIDPDPAA